MFLKTMPVVFVYEMTDVIWIAVIVSCSPIGRGSLGTSWKVSTGRPAHQYTGKRGKGFNHSEKFSNQEETPDFPGDFHSVQSYILPIKSFLSTFLKKFSLFFRSRKNYNGSGPKDQPPAHRVSAICSDVQLSSEDSDEEDGT